MRSAIAFTFVALFLSACQDNTHSSTLESPEKAPHDYMFMQRAYPSGKIDTKAIKEAIKIKSSLASRSKFADTEVWEFAGPENIGGRITDIEIPIDQPEVYYAGAASGGIFKTTDGGASWSPIFDGLGSLAIGDIEISKSNTDIIWVGTGEPNAGGGSLAYDGNGIYNSIDGGLSWTNKGLTDAGSISKVLIDPNDDNTIYVAAMGALFENDTNRGVFRSTDNGSTWERVLFISDSTGFIDMVNHPTNSDLLYAVAWERIRRPQYRQYGGETSGIYRSIDGGENWSKLTGGLPEAAEDKGRISIAISQSNPDVLYARYADAIGSIEGVYRTSDGGDSWVEVNSSQLTNVGFHWWFRGIYIDPQDENTLYNVDYVLEKSIDGGNSWFIAFPNVHVDQHALAFNAQSSNEVLLGNDGGVYRSEDGGVSSSKYTNLPITQFYRFYVDPQDPNKIYGGSQDNSTMRTTTGSTDDWNIIYGGDGFQPLVAHNNTNVIYALSQRGNLVKSVNDGRTFSSATDGISSTDRNNWDTPIAFDPDNAQVLYYGTQRVWKTSDGTSTWRAISSDLTNGSGEGNLSFGTITTIDVSTLDSNIIAVGTDDSNVWITQDGGTNWINLSSTLPNFWTTKVLLDRHDVNTLYVTFSGYRYADNASHVFKSTDLGATWEDIGSSLPAIPVNDIVEDAAGNLFIATDVGVFFSEDEGVSWTPLGSNMPSVIVNDLHIDETSGFLYAATYGRSAYKIAIGEGTGIPLTTSKAFSDGLSIYPNPASEVITVMHPEKFERLGLVFYDPNGKKIYENSVTEKNPTLDISDLKSGVYYVKVSAESRASIKKLIIK